MSHGPTDGAWCSEGRTALSHLRERRKENIEAFATPRPFQPFEIRLVEGQRFRIHGIEQFLLGRNHVAVLNPRGVIVTLSMGLIATIRPPGSRGGGSARRRPATS